MIEVGDRFPLDPAHIGDCQGGFHDAETGLVLTCVLDRGHGGRHVASDGERVVGVWTDASIGAFAHP